MNSLFYQKLRLVLPFLDWIGELNDSRALRADILAGITVAMILIPQSMANAQLAALPPYYGLYAAFLPPAVAALFGSSRQLSTGSVALVSLMTSAALQPIVAFHHADYIAYTILLAFMVGVIQLGLGLLRLGALTNFLSQPVVLGFTNAGAIIIGTSQIDLVFGVRVPSGGAYYLRVWHVLTQSIAHTHLPTLGMAALAFVTIGAVRRFAPRMPGILLAVMVTTIVSWGIGFESQLGGAVVGAIPRGIPTFSAPRLDFGVMGTLLPSALAIALIGFVGTISIARSIAIQTRQRLSANREFIGQGLSNIAGSFFLSHPVAGSFARSAVNLRAGARTGFSSVVAVAVVVITLLWFTPLLYHMPLATLAVIVIVSVSSLLRLEPIKRAWKVHIHDGLVAVATLVLTLILAPRLDVGIMAGVGMSMVLYLYRTMKPRVAELSRHPDGAMRDARAHDLHTCDTIAMVRFDESLYFGSASAFEDMMLKKTAHSLDLRFVIVDAEGINQIDATGEETLVGVVQRLRETRIEVLFARTKNQVMAALRRSGSLEEIGSERFFPTLDVALQHVWDRLERENPSRQSCRLDCPLYRAHITIY